jgi:hypothetical protein
VEDISSVVKLESATYFQNAPTGISRDVKTGTERRAFAAVHQAQIYCGDERGEALQLQIEVCGGAEVKTD